MVSVSAEDSETGFCGNCDRPFSQADLVRTWAVPKDCVTPKRSLVRLALRQLDPLSSQLSPLRHFSDRRVEQYYRRTRDDLSLAQSWAGRYLEGLSLPDRALVLDHGCGRGRNVGVLTQLGFRMTAQDLQSHPWWSHFPHCEFQCVPACAPSLPWAARTFHAVFDFNVINHFDSSQLKSLVAEVTRVLMPGGCWVLLEPNTGSYGAFLPRKHYGRLHSLDSVRQLMVTAGLRLVDHDYEGFYAPVVPRLINFMRKQAWPSPLTIEDFDSRIAALIPPHRRAQWLLRVRKPAVE